MEFEKWTSNLRTYNGGPYFAMLVKRDRCS